MNLILIIILYINFSYQRIIQNGVYNIINNNLNLYNIGENVYLSEKFDYPYSFYKIVKLKDDENFFNIEAKNTHKKLSYLDNKVVIFKNDIDCTQLWKLIRINKTNYLVENYNKCFLTIKNNKLICDFIPYYSASIFQILKIYTEYAKFNKNNSKNKLILEKEPIDVLIKYIDLNDPNLNREEVHQITKDYDNEELRYSIRSILQNIPWVRKIFILMPNEKVRYFKDIKYISNKIVYVKDKDILGYESSNSLAFQYRYWKMKKFNISDNIIVMDDDCFIGKKLEKNDFFYVKHGKVSPLIVTANILKIDKENVDKNLKLYQKKAKAAKEEQNEDIFIYNKYLTYNFIFNLFNITQNLFIPFYTHNAIPINLNDIKDAFDLVYASKYKYSTLDCKYRNYEYLHFQILLVSYTFIKYKKKVNHISHKYIQLNNSITSNYQYSLFCINKGSGNYPLLSLYKAKIVMEYLFPIPTPFEISPNLFYNFTFNFAYSMEKSQKEYEAKISRMITKNEALSVIINIIMIFLIILSKLIKYININSNI